MTNLDYARDGLHDYPGCSEIACPWCDAFGVGDAAGKTACHAELRAWSPHVPQCQCEPCKMVSVVVKTVLSATGSVCVDAPPVARVSVRLEVGDG